MVWEEISLSGHTDLHVLHGGKLTYVEYRDEILDAMFGRMLLLLAMILF